MESCSAQNSPSNPNPNPNPKQNHTHTFESPHPIYAMAFSSSSSPSLALGSFLEDAPNRVDIISFNNNSSSSSSSSSFYSDPTLSFPHQFPPTKLMFHPSSPSLLASSSDSLRLFSLNTSSPDLKSVFNNNNTSNKSPEFSSSPLTSFDWNPAEPRRIGTSSIDTTCTVWDVERNAVETQLIAHDKEVYDIAWGEAAVFASVSADGSVRIFDLRDKEHSAIVYESPRPDTPLLRLAWNRSDLRYMATIVMDGDQVVVLDIRSPAVPVAELRRHCGGVNAVAWAPQTARHLCSVGDDGQALIWELPGTVVPGDGVDPLLVYRAGEEINQMQWSAAQPDWIGIAFGCKVQLLRV